MMSSRRAEFMGVLDALNRRYGKGAVQVAPASVRKGKDAACTMNREQKSWAHTTD